MVRRIDESKRKRTVGACADGLLRAHGKPVYSRAIKGGQINRGRHVTGKDATFSLRESDVLCSQRRWTCVNPGQDVRNRGSTEHILFSVDADCHAIAQKLAPFVECRPLPTP